LPGDGAAAAEPDRLSYEQAVAELEAVVARLEGGDLALEEALRLFERGVALARHCAAQLDAAERQVELLSLDEEGRPVLRPLPLAEEGA
jgi:exodeoxyribonuclease VII small subunit